MPRFVFLYTDAVIWAIVLALRRFVRLRKSIDGTKAKACVLERAAGLR